MKYYLLLDKALYGASKVFEILGMVAVVGLMIVLGGQTMLSWGGISLLWTDEICFLLNFWVVYIGSAVLMYRNGHIQVDFIVNKFPKVIQFVLEIMRLVLCLGVCIYMIQSTLSYIASTGNIATVVLGMPKIVYYIVPMVSFGYFILAFIKQFLDAALAFAGKEAKV